MQPNWTDGTAILLFVVGMLVTGIGLWASNEIASQFKRSGNGLSDFLLAYLSEFVGFKTFLTAALGVIGGIVIIISAFRAI